jgi:deoxyribose-phosphate aldolase
VIVKTAVECDLLDDRHKQLACRLAEDAGAGFVSATSAFGERTVSVDDVELPGRSAGGIGVKAAGGSNVREAEALIGAGAARLGTPFAVRSSRASRVRKAS